jgi:hypothetical protein
MVGCCDDSVMAARRTRMLARPHGLRIIRVLRGKLSRGACAWPAR